MKYFTINSKDYSTGKFISINPLKYAAVIINYSTSTHFLSTLPPNHQHPYPIFLKWADNMSANSWAEKSATSNLKGRCMSRSFCSLRINNSLGLDTDFIAGINNTVTDTIPRICPSSGSAPDYTSLMQEFPELISFQRFHPSSELLSCLMQGLLSKLGPGVHHPATLGYLTQDSNFTSLILSSQ